MPIDQLVTIIGSSYFQPVADLLSQLLRRPRPKPNEVQAGYYENGYCASMILLLVTMLESYVMRVRYINREALPIQKMPLAKYLTKLYPDYEQPEELTEVLVVRDVIAHNHLWEMDVSWPDDDLMILDRAQKEDTEGDNKYRSVVNTETRRTKLLELNVIPTRVGRSDLLKVFDLVWETLLFLEIKDRNQCYVSHIHVRFNGQSRLFGELRADLRDEN